MSAPTLTEFVLARIAEREALARAASPSPWSYPGIESVAGGTLYDATRRIVDVVYEQPSDHDGRIVRHLLVPEADANGAHIAHHDPAHVLRGCARDRRIVERCKWVEEHPQWAGDAELAGHFEIAEAILYDLAAVDDDHPDFQAEWAS